MFHFVLVVTGCNREQVTTKTKWNIEKGWKYSASVLVATCCLFATLLFTFPQNTTLTNYKDAQIKQQKFVAELQVSTQVCAEKNLGTE